MYPDLVAFLDSLLGRAGEAGTGGTTEKRVQNV